MAKITRPIAPWRIRTFRQALQWAWQNKKALVKWGFFLATFLRWYYGYITTDELVKVANLALNLLGFPTFTGL